MSVLNGVVAPVVRVEFDATIPLGVKEPEESDWTALPVDVLRGVSIRRGKTQENQAVQAGEATITLDNRSGDFDPMNSDSPYWVESIFGGLSYFSPRLGMRVVATWDEVDYVLYTGYLEQLVMDYGLNPTVTITCTDALAYLAQQQLVSVADGLSPVGNGDQVWFRVDSLLDPTDVGTRREGCSFPVGLRGIDTSVDNTMYGTRYGSDVLSLLQTAADCGPARLFVDADGLLRLLRWDGGDSPGVLLSDDLSNPDAIGYDSIDVDPGSRYLLNTVWVYKVDGNGTDRGRVLGLASDSRTRFGTFANQYTLPTNNAAPVANFLANQYAEPFDRVRRISFSMMNLGSRFPTVLVMDLADYVGIERTTYDGRSLYFDCNVEGIEYDITPDGFRAAYLCSTFLATPVPPESAYWFGVLGSDVYGSAVVVDNDNAVYASGIANDPTVGPYYAVQVAKTDNEGVLLWQNSVDLEVTTSTGVVTPTDCVVDGSKNLFVVAKMDGDSFLFKFDSSGELLWQKQIADCLLYACGVDGSGNFYAAGSIADGSTKGFIVKMDSSGSIIWQKELDTEAARITGLSITGSYVFAAADVTVSSGGIWVSVPAWLKFDADGTLLAQKIFPESSTSTDPSIVADDSGNSWILFSVGYAEKYLLKLNGSGVIQWAKQLQSYLVWAVTGYDVEGNVFVTAFDPSDVELGSGLVKLDSDGTVLWERNITSGAYTRIEAVVNSANDVTLAGYRDASGVSLLLGVLPSDGSKTGSYTTGGVPIDYTVASYSVVDSTVSATTSTFTTVSGTGSPSVSSLTDHYYEFAYTFRYL